jgi:hypothetical protein
MDVLAPVEPINPGKIIVMRADVFTAELKSGLWAAGHVNPRARG